MGAKKMNATKIIVANKYKITRLSFLLFFAFSGNAVLAAEATDDFSVIYIKKISVAGITALCTDDWFKGYAGFSRSKCIKLLSKYSEKCNELVKPLIPYDTEKEDAPDQINILRSLGKLYSMCLKAETFQDGYCNSKRNLGDGVKGDP